MSEDPTTSQRLYEAAAKLADRLGVPRKDVFAGAVASYTIRRQRLAAAADRAADPRKKY